MIKAAAILASAAMAPALAPALAVAAPAHAASTPGWDGTYVWEDALGRIGGSNPAEGAAAFVTYTLTIGLGTGETGCWLSAEGYQTDEEIACTATTQGTSLIVKFDSAVNSARPARYAPGVALLTLTRGGGALTTQLQALKDSRNVARKGLLFRPAGAD